MKWTKFGVCLVVCLLSLPTFSYRIEGGEYFVGAGFGVNVNVARLDEPKKSTPKAELPLMVSMDYAFDKNIGLFGSFIPSFAAGSMGFGLRAGAKYWFTFLDAPLYPYVSLALSPAFLLPFKEVNHFNIGLSPGVGLNYFVLAKFMVGAHIHMNPSIAFADGDKKFEFSVMTFFDVNLRV